jgi:hypothetical protein
VSIYLCYTAIGTKEESGVIGIHDILFEWTTSLNDFYKDPYQRNILLIIDSLIMDSLVVIQFGRFVFYGTTWRLVFALVMFYGLRAILQVIDVFEFPEGNNWTYPGWFSLFVPYGTTPDFYYSGHVGSCIVHFMEF